MALNVCLGPTRPGACLRIDHHACTFSQPGSWIHAPICLDSGSAHPNICCVNPGFLPPLFTLPSPWGPAGIIGATCANISMHLIQKYLHNKIDDTLDAFSCHGVSGTVGMLMTSCFATTDVNPDGYNGLYYGGAAGLWGGRVQGHWGAAGFRATGGRQGSGPPGGGRVGFRSSGGRPRPAPLPPAPSLSHPTPRPAPLPLHLA